MKKLAVILLCVFGGITRVADADDSQSRPAVKGKTELMIVALSSGEHYLVSQEILWAPSVESLLESYRDDDPKTYGILKAKLDRFRREEEAAKSKAPVSAEKQEVAKLPIPPIEPVRPIKAGRPVAVVPSSNPKRASEETRADEGPLPANCSLVEVTVFRDGRPDGTESRRICE